MLSFKEFLENQSFHVGDRVIYAPRGEEWGPVKIVELTPDGYFMVEAPGRKPWKVSPNHLRQDYDRFGAAMALHNWWLK